MASILPVGEKWRAQVRRSGQSIAKTFKTKGAAQAWARDQEVAIDKGRNTVDAETVTIGVLIEKYREARADSGRPVKPKSNEDYILQRLHDTFQSNLASRLTTQQIVQFAQARKRGVDGKPGAGGYTIEMDLSKLGTVMRPWHRYSTRAARRNCRCAADAVPPALNRLGQQTHSSTDAGGNQNDLRVVRRASGARTGDAGSIARGDAVCV